MSTTAPAMPAALAAFLPPELVAFMGQLGELGPDPRIDDVLQAVARIEALSLSIDGRLARLEATAEEAKAGIARIKLPGFAGIFGR